MSTENKQNTCYDHLITNCINNVEKAIKQSQSGSSKAVKEVKSINIKKNIRRNKNYVGNNEALPEIGHIHNGAKTPLKVRPVRIVGSNDVNKTHDIQADDSMF